MVKLYYQIRRIEHYRIKTNKNAQKTEGDAGPEERRVPDERRSQDR